MHATRQKDLPARTHAVPAPAAQVVRRRLHSGGALPTARTGYHLPGARGATSMYLSPPSRLCSVARLERGGAPVPPAPSGARGVPPK